MADSIIVFNFLQIIGDRVRVPGFEPLSEQTTNNLSIALQGANSYIDVNIALDLIPGSKIVITHNAGPTSGSFGHDRLFKLPSGPPPNGKECPSNCVADYYKILQDYARSSLTSLNDTSSECNDSLSGCEYSDFESGLL